MAMVDGLLTEQEVQDIYDDQDRIAAILSLELSIEIELAEMAWLPLEDFNTFWCDYRRCGNELIDHQDETANVEAAKAAQAQAAQ